MPAFDCTVLRQYAEEQQIPFPENAASMLECYGRLLLEWNEKINLTAITDPGEIVIKHFLDSMTVLGVLHPAPGASLIDVGTGAGFPGMVLKILRPDLSVTLLDGHAKRFLFLEDLAARLDLSVSLLHDRAELAAKLPQYRESFDIATARAVARLPQLAEYCLPFVKQNGVFLAMKGPDAMEEIKESAGAVRLLGGQTPVPVSLHLPDGSVRHLVQIKKITATPGAYPRASAKIKKQPLAGARQG